MKSDAAFVPRVAMLGDIPALAALIERSARALSAGHYDAPQIEAALAYVFGVDSEIVGDGTYYLIEDEGAPIGCGGWSRRRTLFGGDGFAARDDSPLDPARDAARIRAFFVDPGHARRGVAAALLAVCESAAAAAGFASLELMATLPGVAFYRGAGFVAGEPIVHDAGGTPIPFVPMRKLLMTNPGRERQSQGDRGDKNVGADPGGTLNHGGTQDVKAIDLDIRHRGSQPDRATRLRPIRAERCAFG